MGRRPLSSVEARWPTARSHGPDRPQSGFRGRLPQRDLLGSHDRRWRDREPVDRARELPDESRKRKPGGSKPGQLRQVLDWLGAKQYPVLDALVMSIGGNDVGFDWVVTTCLAAVFSDCADEVKKVARQALADLPAAYAALNSQLVSQFQARRKAIGRVFITEYPDPTTGADGRSCSLGLTRGTGNPFDCSGTARGGDGQRLLLPEGRGPDGPQMGRRRGGPGERLGLRGRDRGEIGDPRPVQLLGRLLQHARPVGPPAGRSVRVHPSERGRLQQRVRSPGLQGAPAVSPPAPGGAGE